MKIYILFQTDPWKTRSSRVLFGAFDSYNAAVDAAKANDLYSYNSEVVISEVELNQFGEV